MKIIDERRRRGGGEEQFEKIMAAAASKKCQFVIHGMWWEVIYWSSQTTLYFWTRQIFFFHCGWKAKYLQWTILEGAKVQCSDSSLKQISWTLKVRKKYSVGRFLNGLLNIGLAFDRF